jgi:hypothetical protein
MRAVKMSKRGAQSSHQDKINLKRGISLFLHIFITDTFIILL